MQNKSIIAATILVAATQTVSAGEHLSVSHSTTVSASTADVWSKIGDFCAIQQWHPAVAKCELQKESGTTNRLLTLGDGAQLLEQQKSSGKNSYSYSIEQGPLPVKEYLSELSITDKGGETTITWQGKFLANGVTDEEAKKLIGGIYEGGLASIKKMLNP